MEDLRVGQLVRLRGGEERRVMENRSEDRKVLVLCYVFMQDSLVDSLKGRWSRILDLIPYSEVSEILEDVEPLEEEEDESMSRFTLEVEGDIDAGEVGVFHIGENVLLEGSLGGAIIEVDGYLLKREQDKNRAESERSRVLGTDEVVCSEKGSKSKGRYWVTLGSCLRKRSS